VISEERKRTEQEIEKLIDRGTFQTRAHARYYQIVRGEIRGLESAIRRCSIDDLYESANLEQLDAAIPRGEMPAKRIAGVPSESVPNSKRVNKHARRLEAQLREAKRPLFI
jgi:hypothetical protein